MGVNHRGSRELNPSGLEEQLMLLASKPSLRTQAGISYTLDTVTPCS